jgi:hypothetical protein
MSACYPACVQTFESLAASACNAHARADAAAVILTKSALLLTVESWQYKIYAALQGSFLA